MPWSSCVAILALTAAAPLDDEAQEMIRLSLGAPPAETAALPAVDLGGLELGVLGIPDGASPAVGAWARWFAGPGEWLFTRWASRLALRGPELERQLAQADLPPDLVFVALVESGLNPDAESRLGAVGLWQLTPETARGLGLRVGAVDERRDPSASTRAAVRYLRQLERRFHDWPLALTAYNTGPERLQRAIEKAGTRDLWRLASSGALSPEAANYVPKVMAAAALMHRERAQAKLFRK